MKKIYMMMTMALAFALLPTVASAAFTAPDMSGTITDMGTAFGAVILLVVTFLGFRYIRKMFA